MSLYTYSCGFWHKSKLSKIGAKRKRSRAGTIKLVTAAEASTKVVQHLVNNTHRLALRFGRFF